MRERVRRVVLLAAAALVSSCGEPAERTPPPAEAPVPRPSAPAEVSFTEVAAEVGIDFVHNTGARTSRAMRVTAS